MWMMREFKCRECGKVFEKLAPKEAKVWQCPACGHTSDKVLSATYGVVH